MKLRYTISSICATLALFLLGSTNAKALSYWTQQYDGLPALYDITGIIGYGNNMILGSQPYYTPTSSVSFTASTDGHKVYRFVKDGNIIFGVGDSAILKSMDDGQTWTPTAMSYPIYHIGLNARLYCNGGTVYTWDPFNANFGFDIMKSTDTGNTWQPTGIQKPDGYAFLMHDGVIY